MSTVVLNAYSIAYPTITNRIRASVYLQTSPQALISTIVDSVTGHPARVWTFSGLPRNNYGFSLDEIDGSGNIVSNLALFDVVPGEIDGELIRDDEQIQVDTTVGLVSATNSFIFDGTGGKPNYIGWNITPSELTGRGILARGLDYSWDSSTGTFTLLQDNDYFNANAYFNIHFDPIENPAGNSVPLLSSDNTIELITVNKTLTAADIGKTFIVEPGGTYLEITLPAIAGVAPGRDTNFQIGITADSCVKFVQNGADIINFRRGSIYAVQNEMLTLFVFARGVGQLEWRVKNACGNFFTVGNIVSADSIANEVLNAKLLDGSKGDKFLHARLYNEIILNLPLGQVCNFDEWNTGNNSKLFSLANSSDPANLNKFYFPNRQGLYECGTITGTTYAGEYFANQNKAHSHHMNGNLNGKTGGSGGILVGTYTGWEAINDTNGSFQTVENEGGDQVRPETVIINKYVLI